MNRCKIAKVLALITIVTAAAVIIGWIFNIPILTSILPQWVTMKFTTAFSFLLSGGILYYYTKKLNKEYSSYGLTVPIFSVLLLFLMGVLLVSVFLGVRTGIEDLFVQETENAVFTTTPGRPSVGTMVDFILIGIIGVFFLFDFKNIKSLTRWFGAVIAILGLVALVGYVVDLPQLYYAIEGLSTAMAIHTAILFGILGVGFFIVSKQEKEEEQ